MLKNEQILPPERARLISPITLAFVGDAVYTLRVRERLACGADFKAGELNKLSSAKVSARGQSALLSRLEGMFTEEEADIFRRGRNAKKGTRSKNASVGEYNRSTGFEAVLGYLYLTGRHGRIDELLKEEDED